MVSWDEFNKRKDEEEERKRREEQERIQREERISNYDTARKTLMKEAGTRLREQNEIRKQYKEEIERQYKQRANEVNEEFRKNNPANVTLPKASDTSRYSFRDALTQNEINKNKSILQNIRPLTQEEKDSVIETGEIGNGALFKITNGQVDDRNDFQKKIDNFTAPIGNLGLGAIQGLQNTANYLQEFGKWGASKIGAELLNKAIDNKDTSNMVGNLIINRIADNNSEYQKLKKAKEDISNEIDLNIKKTDNPLSTKLAELSPSIGSNLVSAGVSAVNPLAGTALFMTSAGGSYLDEAKQRGMNDDQALGYATVMGIIEGGTESVITGGMASRILKKTTGKVLSKEFLQSSVNELLENFVQEASTEHLSELTAQIFGGEKSANWNNIWGRSIEAGIDGVLSALILQGTYSGISSSQEVYNKLSKGESVSETEIETMLNDIKKYDRTGYEQTVQGAVNAIKQHNEILQQENPLQQIQNKNNQLNQAKEIDITPVVNESNRFENRVNTQEELPVANEKYSVIEKSLVDSAKKYNLKYKDMSIQDIQNALDKRGIKSSFDDSYFSDSNQGAMYILNKDTGERKIIFNPKANEKTIIQEMAIHELTHDIIASNTETSKVLKNQVLDWLKQGKDYSERLENLKQTYLNIKDANGNQVYNENQSGFNEMVEEEAIAKTLQYKLGTQEQIQRLVNDNRSNARKIYDWVIEKIQDFKNRNNAEYKFWKEVRDNFEKAFNETEFNPTEDSNRYYFENVDYFDEMEYNNSISERVDNKTWKAIDDSIGRENLTPGIYETEAFDYSEDQWKRYTIYYKGKGEYKIINSQTINENNYMEGANNEINRYSKEISTGNDTTRSTRENNTRNNGKTYNRETTKDVSGLSNSNERYSYTNRENNLEVNRNKQSIKNSNESSFNLPKNVKDISNLNQFIREAKQNETDPYWSSQLEEASRANYVDWTRNESRLHWKRGLIQQYLNYKNSLNNTVDNQGRTLLKQQQEYFKDSKANTDIRYSISTDGSMQDSKGNKVTLDGETGNSDKTLLAIHNLSEDKLKGVLELGGFPVPSIAITNPDIVNHSQFGDISVIFNKNTINPANKANEVYDRDVWSPTFPQIDYQLNDEAIEEVANNLGIENWRLSDYAEESNNPDDLVTRLLRNRSEIIDKYLSDNNLQYETKYRNADIHKWFNKEDNVKKFIIDSKMNYDKFMNDSKLREEYYDVLRNEFNKDEDEIEAINKQIDRLDFFVHNKEQSSTLKEDFDTINGTSQVEDTYETNKEKRKIAEENGIRDYIREQITPIYGEKGIYNGKEYLTPSGNRRSFWQLHNEYNLENIVRALVDQDTTGSQQTFLTGFGKINAQMSQKFNSITDIKANQNRLMTDEKNNNLNTYKEAILDDVNKLAEYYKHPDSGFGMQGYENASESIFELAKSNNLTVDNFKKILTENIMNTDNIPESTLTKIIDDLNNLKNLPTDYFEAKPQRAVGFDEIDTIVLPSDTSEEVKQQLKDRGIKTIEYDRNNENAKNEILKSLNQYKFNKATSFDDYIKDRIGKVEGTKTTLGELRAPKSGKIDVAERAKSNLSTQQENNNIIAKKNIEDITNIEEPKTNKDALPATKERETENKIAQVLTEPIERQKPKQRTWAILKANLIDKGAVFEDLSRKTNNRDLQGKYDATLSSSAKGQYAIGNDRYIFENGKKTLQAKSLTSIIDEVGANTKDFYNYMYHQLNIDRMTLEDRFGGDTGLNYERKDIIKNKPVFGKDIDAEYSRQRVAEYEEAHPEFKKYAKDVYDYLDANKAELVKSGVISQELSDKFKEMYPHYVPIARVNKNNNAVAVPLDTNRTGINNPIKRAKGGSSDIQPLFNTMAERTIQTYRASARNAFGVELKNTLEQNNLLNAINEETDVDTIMDTMEDENHTGLTEGNQYQNPTFTVFENGNKVTYEINQDMYDALKPQNELLNKLNNTRISKFANKVSNARRAVLTEYNPLFSITNSIKDAQDVLQNSQHATKTYMKFPEAYYQIIKNGYWYNEYIQNGGEQNSYFKDGNFEQKNNIPKPLNTAKKVITLPFRTISQINNVIEMAPRLAEYIVSREQGRNIETSMLDASRVTTNFKAGGDVTKFLNKNGATFLNAGVQGMAQQIRNIKEANAKGLKGYAVLTAKSIVAGLPALLLNNLVWGDDDDYEELQDYVKDNYYIIGKIGDHQFIRIPKGRVSSVIQKMFTTVDKYITGNKEINIDNFGEDFWANVKFAIDNIAPNSPIENNIISPIKNIAENKTWYGDDLVSTKLQKLPEAEQYDETTDEFSKWLGRTFNWSPKKINYLLDQYGGGASDVLLPLGTPQAENNAVEDKFTTNSIMKNKNPGEFYSKIEKLEKLSNSMNATDEDKLKYKYMSEINSEMSDLYKQKREEQNSSDNDEVKKKKVEEIQNKINKLAKEGLENVDMIKINGNTATINNSKYYKTTNVNDGTKTWKELSKEEYEKNKNISLYAYADYKEKIAQTTINQKKSGEISDGGQLNDKSKISILIKSNYSNKDKQAIYENYIKEKNDIVYDALKSSEININEYLKYKEQISSSSKKADVINCINNLKIKGTQRILLYALRGYATSSSEKSLLYNYVNSLNLSKEEKVKIYKKFAGFNVYDDGSLSF